MRRLQDDLIGSPDVRTYIDAKVKEATESVDQRIKWATQRAVDDLKRNQEAIREFEEASGIHFKNWGMGNIGSIVKQLQGLGYGEDGGLNAVNRLLEGHANALRVTLEQVERVRETLSR